MKKIILPLLVVIIVGIAYSTSKQNFDQATTTEEAVMDVGKQEQRDGSFSGTIKDLMGIGKTQKCTWTAPDQGTTTVYVDGEKTRGEVEMIALEGQPAQQMITISDSDWAYSWNPATKKGMKVKVDEVSEEGSEGETQVEKDNDYQKMVNQEYEFKCESWKADPSMFIPPTDVEFVDMNAMLEQIQQNMGEMKKMCDLLSGEDKAECLKGFEE